MIDTNGDGLPDTDKELKLASVPNLGRGAISAAFEPQILGVTALKKLVLQAAPPGRCKASAL